MAFCRVYLMRIGTRPVEGFPNPLHCFSNQSSLFFLPIKGHDSPVGSIFHN
jgi:hypothetical protein